MSFLCCEKIDPTSLNGASFENDNLGAENQVLTVLTTPGNTIGWRDTQPAKLLATNTTATVSVNTNTPSIGQVLTATSATNATWQTPSGGGVPVGNNQFGVWDGANFKGNGLFDLSNNNYGIGNNILTTVNGSNDNIAIGNNILNVLDKGNNNIAIGKNVLVQNGESSINNIGIGENALNNNVESLKDNINTGYNNIVIGKNALEINVGGSNNIVSGENALQNNGDNKNFFLGGSDNVVLGTNAMQFSGSMKDSLIGSSFNIAIGASALGGNPASKGASFNIAIGYAAMQNINTLDSEEVYDNIAIGRNTLQNITKGVSNVSIGKECMLNINTGSNNIAIGEKAGAFLDESYTIAFGKDAMPTKDEPLAFGFGPFFTVPNGPAPNPNSFHLPIKIGTDTYYIMLGS